jgi:hypothetical protein
MIFKKGVTTLFAIALFISFVALSTESVVAQSNDVHPEMKKIINAHGGMDEWKNQQTLSFKMGNQTHTVDLHSREVKITSPKFSMGNDDGTVWIKQDKQNFEGSPTFYHSLMFYFHTMPFVFADDGINYREMPDKEVNGTNYKALKMSFDEGVGDSSKDEFIVYYHPDSYKMEWMAYTSTYRSQERSDDFGMIHYKKWEEANGFLLPTKLQWHKYNNAKVGKARGDARTFTNVSVSDQQMGDDFYAMPGKAKMNKGDTK